MALQVDDRRPRPLPGVASRCCLRLIRRMVAVAAAAKSITFAVCSTISFGGQLIPRLANVGASKPDQLLPVHYWAQREGRMKAKNTSGPYVYWVKNATGCGAAW